jgi:hypothetical protein
MNALLGGRANEEVSDSQEAGGAGLVPPSLFRLR